MRHNSIVSAAVMLVHWQTRQIQVHWASHRAVSSLCMV